MTIDEIAERIEQLGAWFHNLDLKGIQTAPHHFLGDYPNVKWRTFAHAIPSDLSGKSVLDIGCNAGFYSLEMKRRGAHRVVGVDSDDGYLAQARFAAEVSGLQIEFLNMSVYDVAKLEEKFDLVLFLGVLYHLRHPLLALDLLHDHVAGDMLVFQSMMRGTSQVREFAQDYPFSETGIFEDSSFPRMYFIENSYSHDPTNWWIPNQACVEGMLRSSGFRIVDHPETEVFVCRRVDVHPIEPNAVYPARGRNAE